MGLNFMLNQKQIKNSLEKIKDLKNEGITDISISIDNKWYSEKDLKKMTKKKTINKKIDADLLLERVLEMKMSSEGSQRIEAVIGVEANNEAVDKFISIIRKWPKK